MQGSLSQLTVSFSDKSIYNGDCDKSFVDSTDVEKDTKLPGGAAGTKARFDCTNHSKETLSNSD
jgi:hypothetical protein